MLLLYLYHKATKSNPFNCQPIHKIKMQYACICFAPNRFEKYDLNCDSYEEINEFLFAGDTDNSCSHGPMYFMLFYEEWDHCQGYFDNLHNILLNKYEKNL
jgi:hypothetical protein